MLTAKKAKKGSFVSKLTSLTDVTYTPQEILDRLELNISWAEVLADADDATKRRASQSLGTTPWADVTPQAQALNGYIDPVLEYLYETDQVALDNQGPWVTIRCPWADGHTTGGSTAGYAPLGRGEDVDTRGFKCFHDNCAANHTAEFLKYIATTSGIQAGVHDPAAKLTTRYVFDKVAGMIWDIKSPKRNIRIHPGSFKLLHPHKTTVQTVDGKALSVAMTTLWATSASRVVVAGATYDPSTTARIVESQNEKYINLFYIPEWGSGPIDQNHVTRFTDFLEYLIPAADAREYFTMWLAAKCQDMSFRGAAVVMVAPKQGVGRSTLADMIKTLIGGTNVADVPLAEMIGSSQFNEWQEKPFIVSEETLSGDPKMHYHAYEKLKTLIDPRSRTVTINTKYDVKRDAVAYGTYLFLSNHIHAIAIPEEDRRFFVLENAHHPAQPAYFTALNAWLGEEDADGLPAWGRAVYRWLQTLPVDVERLTAPPPRTQAKREMTGAAKGDLDFTTERLIAIWPDPYINATEVFRVFSDPKLAGPLRFDEDTNRKFVRRTVNAESIGYRCDGVTDTLGTGARTRVRLLRRVHETGEGFVPMPGTSENGAGYAAREELQEYYRTREIDHADIASQLLDILREDDRI